VGQRTNHSWSLFVPSLVLLSLLSMYVIVVCVVAVCGRFEVCECCCYGLMLVGSEDHGVIDVGVAVVASPLGCCW
jgi:hypothetical protein